MKRIFDLIIGIILLFVLLIPFVIISILIKLNSSGPIFYISRRVGKNNQIFYMAKFRTMKNDTPQIHSNDLKNPNYYITSIGKTLRKYSLDELPQIIHVVLTRHMTKTTCEIHIDKLCKFTMFLDFSCWGG